MSSGEPVDHEDVLSMLFSAHGHIGRLAYLVANLMSLVLFGVCDFMIDGMANLVSAVSQAVTGRPSLASTVGDGLQAVVLLAGLYASTILSMKRIRDMGFDFRLAFVILAMLVLQDLSSASADILPLSSLIVWMATSVALLLSMACLLVWPTRRPGALDASILVLHPETSISGG